MPVRRGATRRFVTAASWGVGFLLLLASSGPGSLAAVQEELKAGALTLRFDPGQRRAATALLSALENPPLMPGLPPDILSTGEILVYLAADERAFQALAPGAPDWSGGIAFPEGDRIILPLFAPRAGGRPLLTILRHELAHVALSRYLSGSVPRWFHEGYAQLAARSWGAEQAWTLRLTILLGRLPALENLGLDFQRQRLSAEHAYLLSYTAVEYLQRLGGAVGFTRLLERWRETGELDLALRRTYGVTLGQFEQMWRRDLRGRFGWLLLLTQTFVFWTLLTILLLVLGYWKKVRMRRKLAALEAVVQAQEAERAREVEESSGDPGYGSGVIDGMGPGE